MVIWKLSGEKVRFGFCGGDGKLKSRVKCKGNFSGNVVFLSGFIMKRE